MKQRHVHGRMHLTGSTCTPPLPPPRFPFSHAFVGGLPTGLLLLPIQFLICRELCTPPKSTCSPANTWTPISQSPASWGAHSHLNASLLKLAFWKAASANKESYLHSVQYCICVCFSSLPAPPKGVHLVSASRNASCACHN